MIKNSVEVNNPLNNNSLFKFKILNLEKSSCFWEVNQMSFELVMQRLIRMLIRMLYEFLTREFLNLQPRTFKYNLRKRMTLTNKKLLKLIKDQRSPVSLPQVDKCFKNITDVAIDSGIHRFWWSTLQKYFNQLFLCCLNIFFPRIPENYSFPNSVILKCLKNKALSHDQFCWLI